MPPLLSTQHITLLGMLWISTQSDMPAAASYAVAKSLKSRAMYKHFVCTGETSQFAMHAD